MSSPLGTANPLQDLLDLSRSVMLLSEGPHRPEREPRGEEIEQQFFNDWEVPEQS